MDLVAFHYDRSSYWMLCARVTTENSDSPQYHLVVGQFMTHYLSSRLISITGERRRHGSES